MFNLMSSKRQEMRRKAEKELFKSGAQGKETIEQKDKKVPSFASGFLFIFAGSFFLVFLTAAGQVFFGLFGGIAFIIIGGIRISKSSATRTRNKVTKK